MKLPKITQAGKSVRKTFSLPENESDAIAAYATFYASTHKEAVQESELIRYIVKHYIESDKDFTKYQKGASVSNINTAKKQA